MFLRLSSRLCRTAQPCLAQTRNTVIVKRVHKPPLIGDDPLNTPQKLLDAAVHHSDDDKWMEYEVLEKYQHHHKIKLIMLRQVDDFGQKGEIVEVVFNRAYTDLLLPKFAVYWSEENLERYKDIVIPEGSKVYSSESARVFQSFYSKRVFDVRMNLYEPWTIEPWHIRATLRRHRVVARLEDITIPGPAITGPDLSMQNKEFLARLTINDKEVIMIRCRLHHIGEGGPELPTYWFHELVEPVWEAERQELLDLNRASPCKEQREQPGLQREMAAWTQWKRDREIRLS